MGVYGLGSAEAYLDLAGLDSDQAALGWGLPGQNSIN